MRDTERYHRLADLSPDGIFISRDTRIVFLNPAAVRLFGATTPEQILGKSPFELFHPDCHADIRERVSRLLAGDAVPIHEERIVRLDGAVTDVEVTGTLVEDDEGPAIHVIARDITERKRTEAALRDSERRLTMAFAAAQEGVWDWDLETGAVVYSARWREMLGYAENEIEANVSAWKRLLHPDDADSVLQAIDAVARGERSYELEFRLRHKDGHYVDILSRGLPVRSEMGHIVRIVGTHLDITERKRVQAALRESEERLRLAFAGAQEGVWDWNLETGAVVYSAHWKQMLGYTEDEVEPDVSAWERLLHPGDRDTARQVVEGVTKGERDYEVEFRLRHKSGHYVHVLSRGLPVRREPGGPVVRIVGTHFDLTERKQAEEALRRAHEELEMRVRERTAELAQANESLREEMMERERIERARAELLGRLVFAQEEERRRIAREMHDQFGQQLTALGLRIGMLKEACAGEPDLVRHIEALQGIAQQVDRDVDYLVWELRPTALDDLGLQAALANFVRTWARHSGITVELHAAGLADHRLASEIETTLYRIGQEALNNIAKHSRASHVEIILERRPDHISLVVEDDGVGFDLGEMSAAGRGFGLQGMQERAALVGATLEIESSVGQGTTILVRMPADAPVTDHA